MIGDLEMKNHNQIVIQNESNVLLLLQNKVAVIFGAGGAIGSQAARDFSREGASVFSYISLYHNSWDFTYVK